ncbi:hypothetical protein B296_00010433 [Ensete ventricosum]|uniref:Uncharacterized protein n=1 Tax=Ensete ventricosum TaxID=4639 RepID=A0A427B5I6_ENSVE|nr:hypothetical protein B296_00010433 [Ensete ventricosum]
MEGDVAAADASATSQEEPTPSSSSTKSPFDTCISAAPAAMATSPGEILRALQVVERDSVAIAESYASLFSSLRIALSEVSHPSFASSFDRSAFSWIQYPP